MSMKRTTALLMNEYVGWIAPFLYDNVINDRRRSGRS
jgi:hypothetical protein